MTPREKSGNRIDVIDQYRGFAILLMVVADYLSRIHRVPIWLKHAAGGVGLTVVDLIAPMFILSIGLTFGRSWQRRLEQNGQGQTIHHFLRRFLALIGIGFLTPPGFSWGLLQAIGGAGLITLLFIRLPTLVRLAGGGILLGGYQLLSDKVFLGRVTGTSSWCEIEGTLGWAAMLILATVLADCYHKRYQRPNGLLFGSLVSLVIGIGLAKWIVISQYFVSASYVLITLGASGLLFLVFHYLDNKLTIRFSMLSAWGKNPLLLYLLHYWIWIYAFLYPASITWHLDAPVWLIVLQAGGFVAVLSLIAWFLDQRKWILTL